MVSTLSLTFPEEVTPGSQLPLPCCDKPRQDRTGEVSYTSLVSLGRQLVDIAHFQAGHPVVVVLCMPWQ